MPNSRTRHYLARAGIFLAAVALIYGTVGCGSTSVQYDLTINSTAGGSITTPGEGVFAYDDGTVVELVAEAGEGYYFVSWTGDMGTIGNVNTCETIIIMNDNYSITADFMEYTPMVAAGLSHIVGLKSDGTVVAVGSKDSGQ